MKKIIFYKVSFIILLMLSFGCSEDYLQEEPPHIMAGESLYNSYNGFESGLNGLYALMRIGRANDDHLQLVLSGVDNMCTNYDTEKFFSDWGELNSPTEGDFEDIFAWCYEIINAANTIINRAENENIDWTGGTSSPDGNKNRVLAEARALRAWAYRFLTYCWGDVPLNLEESLGSSINTDWQRTPVEKVRQQIISDLLFAQQHISADGSYQGRITKGAVQHYLAEMYLVKNMPDSAEYWADQVIDNPEYELVTERYGVLESEPGVVFMDMFQEGNQNRLEGNTEALWVIQFEANVIGGGESKIRRYHGCRYDLINIDGVTPLEITFDRGGRNKSYFAPTKFAIDLYEDQDERGSNFAIRKFFILKDEVENAPLRGDDLPPGYSYGDTIWNDWSEDLTADHNKVANWPWSRKADGTDPNDVRSDYNFNDQVYLRLADTYLLKAEAQLKQGFPEQAATTINIVRERSNATPVTDVDLDFILDERSRELFLEEERRFTLLRTHKWLERVAAYNKYGGEKIAPRDTLFPIPQVVIDANLTTPMEQNPGW
ncbi:RagB/SusD family nutrient uptake outer membrane protein [uncultured Draconibacterium sp.]|uniref:RagB/SusD family nutrient uptake outer membrane protein n=1 Tax=uncultured Draconibacterium sp. TaxID=1573823 RepID=UPI002AA6E616|nr:RagB/SusD family nutrient uptake outer membrane protein [uncultured Draconibacterium sp.]